MHTTHATEADLLIVRTQDTAQQQISTLLWPLGYLEPDVTTDGPTVELALWTSRTAAEVAELLRRRVGTWCEVERFAW